MAAQHEADTRVYTFKLNQDWARKKAIGKSVVVVARPLSRDGDMAEDHETPESGQLLRAGTRGRREAKGRQHSNRSWSVQNEIRGVLGWMTAGAA